MPKPGAFILYILMCLLFICNLKTPNRSPDYILKKASAGYIKSPFNHQEKTNYNFSLLGEKEWKNEPVYIIKFQAKEGNKRYMNGTAYISKKDFKVVYIRKDSGS